MRHSQFAGACFIAGILIQSCIQTARVQPPCVDLAEAAAPFSSRTFGPVEAAQVGLLFRVARTQFDLVDGNPMVENTPAPAPAAAPAAAIKEVARKIKFNQAVDQDDEGENPPAQHEM